MVATAAQHALFATGGGRLPSLAAIPDVCAGVDVGGMAKGFHAVALKAGQPVDVRRFSDPRAVVDWCLALDAGVVAVDAPCGWSASGKSRHAERALRAEGIQSYATPTLAVATARPFYRWMLNGADLYLRLARHYEAFASGAAGRGTYLETYPHAVACALSRQVVCARNKRADRRALLAHVGVATARLTNIDYVDAALCAVAGAYARAGYHRAYGHRDEGVIYVPAYARVTPRAA